MVQVGEVLLHLHRLPPPGGYVPGDGLESDKQLSVEKYAYF